MHNGTDRWTDEKRNQKFNLEKKLNQKTEYRNQNNKCRLFNIFPASR